MTRRFIVVGQKAHATGDFLLVDIPSTSGRLDVLLHALRAGLLLSHGVRRDSVVYLVLLGTPDRPRTLRFDGEAARYLRPDERSLATTVKKALQGAPRGSDFEPQRVGIALAAGGCETLWPELAGSSLYLLEPGAPDLRGDLHAAADVSFVLGDHHGLPEPIRSLFLAHGARPRSVGPQPLHTQDAIAIAHNELDRLAPP